MIRGRFQLPENLQGLTNCLTDWASQKNLSYPIAFPLAVTVMFQQYLLQSGNSNPFDEASDRQNKKRRLQRLQGSSTIYKTEPGIGSGNLILPSYSDFNHLVTTPNIIIADKTKYIETLDKNPRYQYMFLRPRQWGKTTFLRTLADYYDKTKRDSFDDTFGQLYIGTHPTNARSALLVLLFDFSSISVLGTLERTIQNFDDAVKLSLREFLHKNAAFLGNPDIEKIMNGGGGECLMGVLRLVQDNHEDLFVGVDEYDAPENSWQEQNKSPSADFRPSFETVAELFKAQFFAIMKQSMGSTVKKYWLTGVLPAFRDFLSPLTSVNNISMWREYHGLCGLTDDEVRTIAKAYLGDSPQLDVQLKEINRWFDSYKFCHRSVQAPLLYNPHQVFTHLELLGAGSIVMDAIDDAHRL